jgi:hypothetical protein
MEPVAKTPSTAGKRGSNGAVIEDRAREAPDQAAWSLKPAE